MKYTVECKIIKKVFKYLKKEYKKIYINDIIVVDCEGVIRWN